MSETVEFGKAEGLFTELEGRGRSLALEAAGIKEGDKVMAVTSRIVRFTVEAKAQAADYEPVQGYVEAEPESLFYTAVIYDPAQSVTPNGDASIFGQVWQQLATELDMKVVDVANRRVDRRVQAKEAAEAVKPKRANVKGGGNGEGVTL